MRRGLAAALLVFVVPACGTTVNSGTAPAVEGLSAPAAALGTAGTTSGPTGGRPSASSLGATSGIPPVGSTGSSTATGNTSSDGSAISGDTSTSAGPSGPVSIGFFVLKDLGPATKALGVNGLATGNGSAQAHAVATLINANGGIGGHRVTPLIFQQDATQDAQTQYEAACSYFFDDHKAIAIVAHLVIPELMACAQQHNVPYVSSGNRAPDQGTLDRFPNVAVPSQMPLQTVVSTEISELVRSGWFHPQKAAEHVTIGLLYADTPDFAAVPNLVAARLRSVGLALKDQRAMPTVDDTSRVAAASSAGSNAALRFASEGINRVLVVDKSGQAVTYFSIAAQNQSYYPRYGISSLELPELLHTVMSSRQLEGSAGIGFAPLWDVPLSRQPPPDGNTKACLAAMQRASEDMSSSGTRASALSICDGGLVLAAAWKHTALTTSGFLSGLQALGTSYAPVMTFSANFRRSRAPAASYRSLSYSAGCQCFAYSGSARQVAS